MVVRFDQHIDFLLSHLVRWTRGEEIIDIVAGTGEKAHLIINEYNIDRFAFVVFE